MAKTVKTGRSGTPAPVPSRADCLALDARDPLADKRALFDLPDGVIYLDGNSLGALPRGVSARVTRTLEQEWGRTLIRSWNAHGWFTLPLSLGDRLGRLIGAPAGTVVACDTISINLFKLIAAALQLRPSRRIILSDSGNFPNDLYMAQGLIGLTGGHELRIVAPEAVAAAITADVALVMLTEVDYRTGRLHDMVALTRQAHGAGALILWDLAHSAGALPVDLAAAGADFAVGCTYKFLNGGPGAPAFLYVKRALQDTMRPALAGWWGHVAPFAFDPDYRPASGIARMQCGTQSMLAMAALDAALDVWDGIDLVVLRAKSVALGDLLATLVEAGCARHGVTLAGPRHAIERGSQVAFHCPQGYAVMQALAAHGVVGDFRAPDLIRFGLAPLYNSYADIHSAAATLVRVLDERLWDRPDFRTKAAVT